MARQKIDLSGYTTVQERLDTFRKKYPDGTIVCSPPQIVHADPEQAYALMQASITFETGGPIIATGTAWVPIPGLTNFTKNSEIHNAETHAVGRALRFAGIGEGGIASREEVRAQQPDDWEPDDADQAEAELDAHMADAAEEEMAEALPAPAASAEPPPVPSAADRPDWVNEMADALKQCDPPMTWEEIATVIGKEIGGEGDMKFSTEAMQAWIDNSGETYVEMITYAMAVRQSWENAAEKEGAEAAEALA